MRATLEKMHSLPDVLNSVSAMSHGLDRGNSREEVDQIERGKNAAPSARQMAKLMTIPSLIYKSLITKEPH